MNREQAIEAGAQAAFWSDDFAGHHKPGPRPHTWQNIPAEGRENYRTLVAAVLDAVGWRPEAEVKAEAIDRAIKFLADGAYPPIVDRGDPRAGMLARLRAWDGAE